MLREEVRIARQASDLTAQLVVQQFVKIEDILLRLEEQARVEQELGAKLTEKLRESEMREAELARDRQRLEDMQVAAINMMEDIAGAREAAEEATRTKSEFLANMSHEIRTPMTAILGFTDVLLESNNLHDASGEQIQAAKIIKSNGEYLLQIINDILDISKIEAGKMTLERISCSPCRLIVEVAALMRVRASAKGLALEIEYDGAMPESIRTDPTRLRQVLVNVIGNAIKFTEVGRVRLVSRLASADNEPLVQFDVVDTGIGMTEEQVANLYKPFTQADTSTTRKFGGTGLGLTISKRLAMMLGGDIILVETTPGAGAHFRISVATGPLDNVTMIDDPASTTTVIDKPSERKGESEEARLSGCRILLAEDGPDNQRLIAHMVRKAGATVTIVENGKLGVDVALAARDQGCPFDVILMDMQMPVMDGYAATRLLRQKGHTGSIIALTAHAMASDREKCLAAGCDDYTSKPIDKRRLIDAIRQQLRRAAATIEATASGGETLIEVAADSTCDS